MEVSGQLHAPATLPPGNSPWYPLDRRLCESQSRSERGGEEKKFPAPAGNRTPVHPARSLALIRSYNSVKQLYFLMHIKITTTKQK